MPEQAELERLAGAISMLRPDWPAGSVKRFIAGRPELANRPLRDLGLALFWVATDPESKTPARVLEAGPWWWVLRTDSRTTVPDVRAPACPDHPENPATACADCAASVTPPPANWRTPREDQPA